MGYVFPRLDSDHSNQVEHNGSMPLNDLSVLVLESAVATRRIFQEQLNQLGAKSVVFADTPEEASEALRQKNFALFISEYQLDAARDGQQLLEELFCTQTLGWGTAFMMVTGERSYAKVAAVAEFQPDDYLIKPFSGAEFSQRVIRMLDRRQILIDVYKAFVQKNYEELLLLCEVGLQDSGPYTPELMRFRIEALFGLKHYDLVINEMLMALDQNPKPWMRFYLARAYRIQGALKEASELLQTVLKYNAEYLAASDLLAQVLWEQDAPDQALEVLERLGPKALASSTRLRQLGHLSMRVGDPMRSKRYFSRLLERSINTSLFKMHDVLCLSKIYVEEGRYEEAERWFSRLRACVSVAEIDFVSQMFEIQKDVCGAQIDRAADRLRCLLRQKSVVLSDFEPDILTHLLEMCFAVGMHDEGYELVPFISSQSPSKALLDRIRLVIEMFKGEGTSDQTKRDPSEFDLFV